MDIQSISLETDRCRPSRMLRTCRLSDPPGEDALPECSWVRKRDSEAGPRTIWSPEEDGTASDPALLIRGGGQPDWALTLRIWRRYRSLSPLEVARTLSWLIENELSLERAAREAAPLMGLPASPEWVRTHRRMTDLPRTIRRKIHEGELSPKLIRYVLRVPEPLLEALWDPLGRGDLDLTVQEGRILAEAARRLSGPELEECADRLPEVPEDKSPRERGEWFLELLRSRAYPETTRRRREFERDRASLDLDGRLRVSPPDRFEGDYLDFRFRCHRDDDFESFLEDLKRCRTLFEHV